ncbi:universal stress protein [Streptomyces sp. NPDC054796]
MRPDTVLGLDPSHDQGAVVDFAFKAAARRGAALRVVHAWRLPLPHAVAPISPETWERDQAAAGRKVEAVLRPWRAKYPEVPVRLDLRCGSPRGALLAVGRESALVVVGRRSRPRSLGPRLGSFAHTLLHRAAAPVAVVPHA